MGTIGKCANCRHWQPHAGSPTNMICGIIRSTSPASGPRVILDLIRQKPAADHPMALATPADFGCVLYDDGARSGQPATQTLEPEKPMPEQPHPAADTGSPT